MTYERFQEYVDEAVNKHISRDASLISDDLEWEIGNLCETLAHKLRMEGCIIERPLAKHPQNKWIGY